MPRSTKRSAPGAIGWRARAATSRWCPRRRSAGARSWRAAPESRRRGVGGEQIDRERTYIAVVRLARGRTGQCLDEEQAARRLVPGHPLAAPGDHLGLVECVSVGGLHERDDALAVALVGYADHDAVEDAGMVAQLGLDLFGVDLLAA